MEENVENFDSQSTVEEKLVALEKEYADFRRRVAEKALELAEENDWCEVVNDALKELGLPVPETFTMGDSDGELRLSVDTPIADVYNVTAEEKTLRLEVFRKWVNHPDREITYSRYSGNWDIR